MMNRLRESDNRKTINLFLKIIFKLPQSNKLAVSTSQRSNIIILQSKHTRSDLPRNFEEILDFTSLFSKEAVSRV